MRAYKAFDESGIEELGPVSKDQVPSLIQAAQDSLSGRHFGIGFYRDERDFMEVRPTGPTEYLIWSDCLVSSGGLLGLFSRKRHIQHIAAGQQQAADAVLYYMDNSRAAFERKYG